MRIQSSCCSSIRILLSLITALWLLMFINSSAPAQENFTDVTEEAGLGKLLGQMGATWGDYDNDGYVDLLIFKVTNGTELYRNTKFGWFLNVTQAVGLIAPAEKKAFGSTSAILGDFDNDGDLDLFTGGNGSPGDVLYQNNGDDTFRNVSEEASMETKPRQYFGAISIDYDNDGLLDIYIANFDDGSGRSVPNRLYHNQGNWHFREIAAQVGLDKPEFSDGIALGDYDNDGDTDIFIAAASSGQSSDALYRNEGNGVYTDLAQQAGVRKAAFHKNALFWDYDNDGDLDLFVHSWPSSVAGEQNILYRNNGDGTFRMVTPSAGIETLEVDSSGANCGDYDNDGWLDLCVTYHNSPTQLYHNNRDGTFTEVAGEVGIDGTNSGTVSFVDYDNDGDLDIFTGASTGKITLYQNSGTPNHWLQLELVGQQSNRDAIGARVTVVAGGQSMIREVGGSSGGWYGTKQDRLPVHFGLGSNPKADLVEIRWPSGVVDVLPDIPADQTIQVIEGAAQFTVPVQPRGKLPGKLGGIRSIVNEFKPPAPSGDHSELLQNYPNPFNPETWIPFVLHEAVDVEIRIHDASGVLVRTLRLGRKAPGEYFSKDRAAYWDGKNDMREALGSGVYFYEMRTKDHASVRKAMMRK